MLKEVPHFINGECLSKRARKLDIYQPAQGKVSGFIHVADKNIVDLAVAAAKNAFPAWAATTPQKRANFLFRYKFLLEQHLDELALLITNEHGKTLDEAKASLQRGIDVVNYACDIPYHLQGCYATDVARDTDAYSLHQPHGVCVGITPFNFPGMIPLWMFVMAIACGNTFVLKPSEKDPSCSLRLIELAHLAGIPAGVMNIVQGDKETVDALLIHPEVKAISFVGSSSVAEYVYKTATSLYKRVQAFGGAKNHCVIMSDADLNIAADAIVNAAFGSAGERCMALSVVLTIGDEIAEQLLTKMLPLIAQFKMGDGINPTVKLGPLVSAAHLAKVTSYIKLGQEEGATLLLDGSQAQSKECAQGFFMGPTIFDHVKAHMRIYREEIFGPVLCIMRVADFNTAIQLINEHEYGNGVVIFTKDSYTAKKFAEQVAVGMVGINVPVPVPVAYHSFGGWKRSVFADIGMYGDEAIHFYTKLKTVTQRFIPKESTCIQ